MGGKEQSTKWVTLLYGVRGNQTIGIGWKVEITACHLAASVATPTEKLCVSLQHE